MRYFRIKNYEKFQHYKSANGTAPAWIKLYRDLLLDFEFRQLPDSAKAHLVLIWLLASQKGNRVPCDPKFVASSIGATEKVNLDLLIRAGFLELEPETDTTLERSQETTLERSPESGSPLISSPLVSSPLPKEISNRSSQPTQLPPDWKPSEKLRQYAIERGVDPDLIAEEMRDWASDKGATGRDWDARYRRFVRGAARTGQCKLAPGSKPRWVRIKNSDGTLGKRVLVGAKLPEEPIPLLTEEERRANAKEFEEMVAGLVNRQKKPTTNPTPSPETGSSEAASGQE